MGGSLALALRPRNGRAGGSGDVVGRNRPWPVPLTSSMWSTAIWRRFVAGADLVVLATPVRTILALLEQLPPRPGLPGASTWAVPSRRFVGPWWPPWPGSGPSAATRCATKKAPWPAATADLYLRQTLVPVPTAGPARPGMGGVGLKRW